MNNRLYRFSILLLLFLSFSLVSYSQIFKGMLIAGGNLSQMGGDQVYGFKRVGANVGLGVMAPLNEKKTLLIGLELLYNQMGAREIGDPFKYNTRLHYTSIPLLLCYEDRRGGLTFGLGLQYSRLFKVNEDWGLPNPPIKYMYRPDLSTVKDFNKDDISLLFDFRFKVWQKIKLNFRYQCSLIPIRKEVLYDNSFPSSSPDYKSWKRDFYHSVISMRVIYVINERSERELDRRINRNEY